MYVCMHVYICRLYTWSSEEKWKHLIDFHCPNLKVEKVYKYSLICVRNCKKARDICHFALWRHIQVHA